jgi:hypothetical protein
MKPAPPALYFSTAVKADGDVVVFDNHGYFAPAVRIFQHLDQSGIVFEHIYILKRNLAAGEILTGSRSIRSEILTEDQHFFH